MLFIWFALGLFFFEEWFALCWSMVKKPFFTVIMKPNFDQQVPKGSVKIAHLLSSAVINGAPLSRNILSA
jgi:hypothetical protein